MADSTIIASVAAEAGAEFICKAFSAGELSALRIVGYTEGARLGSPDTILLGSRRSDFSGPERVFVFADSEDRVLRQGFLNAVALLSQDEEPGADDAKRNIKALVDTASRQDLKALAEDLLLSALGSAWHGNPMEVINTAHEWIATLQEVKVSGRRIKRILAAREELRK